MEFNILKTVLTTIISSACVGILSFAWLTYVQISAGLHTLTILVDEVKEIREQTLEYQKSNDLKVNDLDKRLFYQEKRVN